MSKPVIIGKRRFTCLSPTLVRMEFSHDGHFENRRSIVAYAEKKPIPFRSVEQRGDVVILDTGRMKILSRQNECEFFPTNLQIQWQEDGILEHWSPGDRDHDNLGGTVHSLDLYGPDSVIDNVHAADSEPLDAKARRWHLPHETDVQTPFGRFYETRPEEKDQRKRRDYWGNPNAALKYDFGATPARPTGLLKDMSSYAPGILSRSGFCLLNDSQSTVMDKDDFPIERNHPGCTDWYFFCYGRNYRQGLRDFWLLSGAAPLPSKNIFGIIYSRWPAYDEKEARQIIADFRQKGTPLSVLMIDMEWHRPPWCNWDWNFDFYPDPPGFIEWAHGEGVQISLNVHPERIHPVDSHYDEYLQALDGKTTFAPAMSEKEEEGEYLLLNLCDKREEKAFFKIFHRDFAQQGVDFWWLDGDAGYIAGTHKMLVNSKSFYEDLETETRRSMLMSRFAGIGNHRYGVYFTGDTFSCWNTLKTQCEFNIRAGHVGMAYITHDIGGFIYPNSPIMDPVLYLRWVQFGAFNPVFRFHSCPGAGSRLPWDYGDRNESIANRWLSYRNSLAPYIYTAAREHHDTGIPIVRGIFLDEPENEAAYRFDQFLFGDSFLVAPILSTDEVREVYLPAGTWYENETATQIEGGRTIRIHAGVADLPLYVRAGSLIPRQDPLERMDQPFLDDLILDVYPALSGSGSLYEDDTRSNEYRKKNYCRTRFGLSETDTGVKISIAPIEGRSPSKTRQLTLNMYRNGKPKSVHIDGKELETKNISEKEGRIVIQAGDYSVEKGCEILIT